ncbi:MAG: FprA family A-type flavoprotein [Candidatus Brockarchaeota archaeon]|nr:FprA family A-type flavoprotein [Candidatus Brockarchaeota archaeon]
MIPREIGPRIYSIGAVDWDRRIFDELIPLPDGTTYNAYLVKGNEKTALVDTVDPSMGGVLVENLRALGVKNLDYIVANHAEQDHSGALPQVLKLYPDAKVLASPKCKEMLVDLSLSPESRVLSVGDGEAISLGDKTLEFMHAPWVHWPETMLTYLRESEILFTCDLFGSHFASSDLYVSDEAAVYEAAKRYYAEIMMPFRTVIQKHLEKIKNLPISTIAPSHGPIYDKPNFIIEAYREWVSAPPSNLVVLPYVSMHGSTKEMVRYLAGCLVKRGIAVKQFDLARTDIGKLAMALVDAATIVIGSPTTLAGPHPNAAFAAYLVGILRPKLKFASAIGSYGWGGKMVEQIFGMISNLKVELIPPVVIRGYPKAEDYEALERLADAILSKHEEHRIVDRIT